MSKATCETHGHVFGVGARCVMCGANPSGGSPHMTTDEWIAEARKVATLLDAASHDPQPMRLHFEDCWRVSGHSSCLHAKAGDMITGLLTELDAARARERHALVAGAEALRRIAAATPIGHEDVTKGPSTYTWLCYAASLLMAEAATTPATPLEQELITLRAREAKLREAATALRIDANRLCDRNLGGTYEEDCRRSIAALDAALAEGDPHA